MWEKVTGLLLCMVTAQWSVPKSDSSTKSFSKEVYLWCSTLHFFHL